MECPKDKNVLQVFQVDNTILHVCSLCAGVWFGGDEFKKVVDKFVQGVLSENFKKWREFSAIGEKEAVYFWQEATLLCPIDHQQMMKYDYAGDSKIHIDHCLLCEGFWLDGNEIMKLWEYSKPDASKDALGPAIIEEMEDFEHMKEEIASFLAGLGGVSSPQQFLIFVARMILEEMTKKLVKQEDGSI